MEHLVKIDVFRRFIPRAGDDGKGLIQFYGLAATRRRPAEDRSKPMLPMSPGSPYKHYPPSDEPWGEWDVKGPKLVTVEVRHLK